MCQFLFRGDATERHVRAFVMVGPYPVGCLFLHFGDRIEQVMPEPVMAKGPVVALDVSILPGLATPLNNLIQGSHHAFCRQRQIHIHRPMRRLASQADADAFRLYGLLRHLALTRGPHHFFAMVSWMISALSRSSAHILLKRRFSSSSSLSRAMSDASMSPNLASHLQNIAVLMPCSRHSSGSGLPPSAFLRMAMIWLSEKRDVFTQNSLQSYWRKF